MNPYVRDRLGKAALTHIDFITDRLTLMAKRASFYPTYPSAHLTDDILDIKDQVIGIQKAIIAAMDAPVYIEPGEFPEVRKQAIRALTALFMMPNTFRTPEEAAEGIVDKLIEFDLINLKGKPNDS